MKDGSDNGRCAPSCSNNGECVSKCGLASIFICDTVGGVDVCRQPT